MSLGETKDLKKNYFLSFDTRATVIRTKDLFAINNALGTMVLLCKSVTCFPSFIFCAYMRAGRRQCGGCQLYAASDFSIPHLPPLLYLPILSRISSLFL